MLAVVLSNEGGHQHAPVVQVNEGADENLRGEVDRARGSSSQKLEGSMSEPAPQESGVVEGSMSEPAPQESGVVEGSMSFKSTDDLRDHLERNLAREWYRSRNFDQTPATTGAAKRRREARRLGEAARGHVRGETLDPDKPSWSQRKNSVGSRTNGSAQRRVSEKMRGGEKQSGCVVVLWLVPNGPTQE